MHSFPEEDPPDQVNGLGWADGYRDLMALYSGDLDDIDSMVDNWRFDWNLSNDFARLSFQTDIKRCDFGVLNHQAAIKFVIGAAPFDGIFVWQAKTALEVPYFLNADEASFCANWLLCEPVNLGRELRLASGRASPAGSIDEMREAIVDASGPKRVDSMKQMKRLAAGVALVSWCLGCDASAVSTPGEPPCGTVGLCAGGAEGPGVGCADDMCPVLSDAGEIGSGSTDGRESCPDGRCPDASSEGRGGDSDDAGACHRRPEGCAPDAPLESWDWLAQEQGFPANGAYFFGHSDTACSVTPGVLPQTLEELVALSARIFVGSYEEVVPLLRQGFIGYAQYVVFYRLGVVSTVKGPADGGLLLEDICAHGGKVAGLMRSLPDDRFVFFLSGPYMNGGLANPGPESFNHVARGLGVVGERGGRLEFMHAGPSGLETLREALAGYGSLDELVEAIERGEL